MNPLDNPDVRQKLIAYAKSLGFKPEDIKMLSADPRLVTLAVKALAWDALHQQ